MCLEVCIVGCGGGGGGALDFEVGVLANAFWVLEPLTLVSVE